MSDTVRLCPKCRQPLPPDAPLGLCPACLLSPGSSFANPPAPGPDSYAEPPQSQTQDPVPGTRLGYVGDYELLEEIARGGMGVVYRARQSSLKRIVAVKMIRSGELAGDAEVKRFRAEAEAAANLKHPNIVAIHEIGEHEGRHYFSMDLVEGKNLAQFTTGKPVAARQAAEWLKAIAEAVQFAHQRGVLHRDLKPQNILVDAEGRPHVTDFGLAKNLHTDSGVTRPGDVMGSPSYMAPEQARGRNDLVGPASDVYSLGAVLYELLTGRAPFLEDTPLETLHQVVNAAPVPPSKLNPNTPPDLETICLKCLEKDVTRRYPTARALAEDVSRFLNGEPVQARPASAARKALFWLRQHPWAVTGLFSLAALGLMGLAYGLAEEAAMLRWKLANGAKPRFTAEDFFPRSLAILLVFEFFFFQSLPWIAFTRKLVRDGLGRGGLTGFAVLGLAQALFGLWLADTGLRHEIWVNRFGFSTLFWGTAAFSNVWFGVTLAWTCARHLRDFRAPSTRGNDAPAQAAPAMNQPGRLADLQALQAIVLGTVLAGLCPLLKSYGKAGEGMLIFVGCGFLFFAGILLTMSLVAETRFRQAQGQKRAGLAAQFAAGGILTAMFGLVGTGTLATQAGLAALAPMLATLLIGFATHWAATKSKHPARGKTPDSPSADPASNLLPIMDQPYRLSHLVFGEAAALIAGLVCLFPLLKLAGSDSDSGVLVLVWGLLFFAGLVLTLTIITAARVRRCSGLKRMGGLILVCGYGLIALALGVLGAGGLMEMVGWAGLLPAIVTLAVGIGAGWVAVRVKRPAQAAEPPNLRVMAASPVPGPAASPFSNVIITHWRRVAWLFVIEMAVLGVLLWWLYPSLGEPGPGKSKDPAMANALFLFVWGMSWTNLMLTTVAVLKSRGIERTVALPGFLLCVSLVGYGFLLFPSWHTPFFALAVILATGVGFGWAGVRLNCVEGGEFSPFWSRLWQSIRRPDWRRVARRAAVLVAALALALVVERVRGQWKLAAVKRDMEARGQVTDIRKLLPPLSREHREFNERFESVAKKVGNSMLGGGGNRVDMAPGKAARGSQAPRPIYLTTITNGQARLSPRDTNTWAMLEQRLSTNQTALAELRELLRKPPPTRGVDLAQSLRGGKLPNFVPIRTTAQMLNDDVVMALHRGDIRAAEDSLVAMAGLVRFNSDDPTLVNVMIRIAVAGLGTSALWDALQADGWTEPQLQRLQEAWQMPSLLPALAKAMHFERLYKPNAYEHFRGISYREWDAHQRKSYGQWNYSLPKQPESIMIWREHVFHPLWKIAWADQEKAHYLLRTEFMTTAPQKAMSQRGFAGLNKVWLEEYEAPRLPFASWRFYLTLPFEDFSSTINPQHSSGGPGAGQNLLSLPVDRLRSWLRNDFTIPAFGKAWSTAARNEVWREMAVTSLALKRHALRHGHYPERLAELVPAFLPTPPVDWMSGHPLRYRANRDGTYLLYSVGPDGVDDDGKPVPEGWYSSSADKGDLVWPQPVPWEK